MALPGVSTTINDGGLRVRRTISGEKVLLLGCTDNSALTLNEPSVVTDAILAMSACRLSNTGESELSLGLADALRAGAQFLEIMKIDTSTGGLGYTGYSTQSRFTALSGAYNALQGHPTNIVVPLFAYADDLVGDTYVAATGVFTGGSYTSSNFAHQLANFCYQQTLDYNATIGVVAVKPPQMAPLTTAAIRIQTGNPITGDNGYWFKTPSRALITGWVAYLTNTTVPSTAVMNTKWLSFLSGSESSYASAYFADWQALGRDGIADTDDLGNQVDAGAYISVFAGPAQTYGSNSRKFAGEMNASTSNTSYNTDGAAAYAGLIASLPPHIGTTNKSVPGLLPARALSLTEAETLRDARIVSLIQRARGFIVVEDVVGSYYVDRYTKSDFHRLTTVRITHAAAQGVREAIEQYIGQPVNAPQLNAMRESIENKLRALTLAGALRRYDFDIIATPDQQSLGEATVNLELVPAFELTNVTTSVRLAKE